ncbi:MAG: MmgE/PrpD family protein [bacterium]|nr:MmgE/PrpD family protein [bacterium]MDE0290412.1 MmgE/PrpD family protein [bacterium]MDE0437824.1 MmgE/PrpD family protein [bacterium]
MGTGGVGRGPPVRNGRDFAPVPYPTQTERLAAHAVGLRFEDIPRPAVDKMKDHIVHHLGLALRDLATQEGSQAVRIAESFGHEGSATIVGTRTRTAPLEATFANTTLMRSDFLDDVIFPAGVHAALVTLPPALAVAEERHCSGEELLTALVAGYDVIGKLGNPAGVRSARAPRRPTIPFGPFGGAAAVARLLGLSEHRTAHALGYAAHSGMGLSEGDFVTHYYSLVARNGLMAALAASHGGQAALAVMEGRFGFWNTFFTGVPPALDDSLGTLGKEFEIMNATTKRYPGTGLNIVPIELTTRLVEDYSLTATSTRSVTVFLPVERENFVTGHMHPPFESEAAARSSLVLAIATILATGTLDPALVKQYTRPDLVELCSRIRVVLEDGHPIRYARIEIDALDGRSVVAEGHDHAFDPADWFRWLSIGGSEALGRDTLAGLTETLSRLEELDDVANLTTLLRPSG